MTDTAHTKPCGCQEIVYDNKFGKARSTILCWHHSHGPGRFDKEKNMSRHSAAVETSAIIEDLKAVADEWEDKGVRHIHERLDRAIEELVYAYDYMVDEQEKEEG